MFIIQKRRKKTYGLDRHHAACTKPWLIVGDFNFVLKAKNRKGGNYVAWVEVVDFHKYVETCDKSFTWNDKGSNHMFSQKLTRSS